MNLRARFLWPRDRVADTDERIARATLLAALAAVAACGGGSAGPPAAPRYDPVGTPEAASPCPDEHAQAKTAREAMVGTGDPGVRLAAARAVFAQAECERQAFDRMRLDAPTDAGQLEAVRQAGAQHRNARNLYEEVVQYGELELLVAGARLGDLHRAFAAKLRAAGVPGDVRDPAERAEYAQQLAELSVMLDREAALAYARALEAAAAMHGIGGFDARAAPWVSRTCDALGQIDARARVGRPICAR